MTRSTAASNDNGLQKSILDSCRHIAGPNKIMAICQTDDYAVEVPTPKSTIEVLIVLKDFQPRLMSHVRIIGNRNVIFFAVDQWVFERDVDRGFLGEALAQLLILPYSPLENYEFLHKQEVALKKRLIVELLENLVLSYPELSYQMKIEREYFMYELLLNRVRIFPPMAYGIYNFICGEVKTDKIESVVQGFIEALNQLNQEGSVILNTSYVTMSPKFIEANRNPKIRFGNTLKNAPRTIFTSLFAAFPQLLNFLANNADAFRQFQTPPWKKEFNFPKTFTDPRRHILVPTTEGIVTLADKVDIKAYVKKVLRNSDKITVEEFGGFLNDIYLIRAYTNQVERKILVKRFKDLSSMKWFPLSMWSIGTRSFALMGKSRLERETAINRVLGEAGFKVPKILHVSADERLVFMEFVEGENISNSIKRIALSRDVVEVGKDLEIITRVGETYAKVHSLDIVLGDTKPENILVDKQGNLCLLDFEQASHGGDKSWDVACFLYYCGHYLPMNGEEKADKIAEKFVEGYLKGGGMPEIVKCAGITKYTRVFSIFTLPNILRAMSNTCKRLEGPRCKKQ
jgi:tRNA A-37 threonylcarbamoyl transferase component Bud32